ncbi:MAG: Rrf2 family transcriptional regulator [Faecalibacillus faecis]
MRIRKSFEQAICILLLIGTSEGPLKSHELSKKLDVSDSYLKKVTRQLVVAGLITSKASKLGGFILNKKMNDISFLDIFEAIEGKENLLKLHI